MEELISQINNFGGVFQGCSQAERPDGIAFTFTRGGGTDPIETMTITITADEKNITIVGGDHDKQSARSPTIE